MNGKSYTVGEVAEIAHVTVRTPHHHDEIMARPAEPLAAGGAPEHEEAMDAAERHRRHIDRWFYRCSRAMHAGLAEMYVTDRRFGEYFERRSEGLTEFVAAAIRANAARTSQTPPRASGRARPVGSRPRTSPPVWRAGAAPGGFYRGPTTFTSLL